MTEYIDREALIAWLKRIPLIDLSDGRGLCRVIMEDDFKKAIKKMPKGIIADVTPVRHGRWVWHDEEFEYECSACSCTFDYNHTFGLFDHGFEYASYCPNCGAKMDLEDSECDT